MNQINNNMINDKQILEILKNDKPIDACINVYSPYHIHVTINMGVNYKIEFWFIKYRHSKDIDRHFQIIKKSENDYSVIYDGIISEENYTEYDYLIKRQAEKFVSSKIKEMLSPDDIIF